jgi:hypothetical protein
MSTATAAYYSRIEGHHCESFFFEAEAANLESDGCFLERVFGATECKKQGTSL